MVVEAVGGWVSGSLALLADAGHMLTDVGAIAVALISARLAERPADARRTYGYLRLEILAALLNGAVLVALSAWIVVEAVSRVRAPHAIQGPLFGAVAVVGLLVNVVALRLLHGDHTHDLNTRGAYLHILGDLLGSVGAIVAAVLVTWQGWTLADPVVSVLISVLIVAGGWRLMKESVDILLEAAPAHVPLERVTARLGAVEGVCAVHDLHVWTLTSGVVAMSGHVVVPDLGAHPRVLAAAQHAMGELGIGHATIQVEVAGGCEPCDSGALRRRGADPAHGHEHAHDGATGHGHTHPHPH